MGSDMMDVDQLAAYLRRDAREVGKLASRGRLPGHRVGGEWRFARRGNQSLARIPAAGLHRRAAHARWNRITAARSRNR